MPDLVSTLVTRQDVRVQARLLELVGRLQGARGSRTDIAAFAETWLGPGAADKSNWRDVLTACLLASTASQAGREDLAQQAIWQIVRAHHRAIERGDTPDPSILDVAHLAFEAVATDLWDQIRAAADPVEVTSRATTAAAAFIVHPIKVARLCETLSMLALLRMRSGDSSQAVEILDFVDDLVQHTPALSHPVGEEWAYSILVTAVALAASGHRDTAVKIVSQAAIWLLDWTESGLLLPPVGATPSQVIDRMLATAYRPPRAPGSKAMYSFAVVADLAAMLTSTSDMASPADDGGNANAPPTTEDDAPEADPDALFADIINDLHALRAMATLKVPTGIQRFREVARVDYGLGALRASHHRPEVSESWPVASWFESLEIWGTYRDRHLPGVLEAAVRSQEHEPGP